MKTAAGEDDFKTEDSPHTAFKIGEVSRISGVGIEALRFYERSGLLKKPVRSTGGYRIYDGTIFQRLNFIKKAQALGFSLTEIKRIIEEAESGESPCHDVREIVRRRLAELDERMRELKRYRKELAATLDEWDAVGRAPGNICGLIESVEVARPVSVSQTIAEKHKH